MKVKVRMITYLQSNKVREMRRSAVFAGKPASMLFFVGILVIRAEVCFAPCHHGLQDGDEALPKLSK